MSRTLRWSCGLVLAGIVSVLFAAGVLAASVAAHRGSGLAAAPAAGAPQAPAVRVPAFEVDPSWPKLPAKWILGDVSSVAVDASDNVWVLHRPRTLLKPEEIARAAPPVVVFDAAGNFVKAWGGDGAGFEWPEREHGIHVDHRGFVWITGNNCPTNGLPRVKPVNDDQVLKLTQDGKLVRQIGRSNRSTGNADTANVHRAADVWVHPATNEAFVADGYGNTRLVVFDADTGAFKRFWGAFGKPPGRAATCEIVRVEKFPEGPGPDSYNIVHAVRVARDGMVYVADRENRRVQVFTGEGKYVTQLVKTDTLFARNLALSSDPAQRFLYVGNGDDILAVDRMKMEVAGRINPPGIINGHHIATDSKGNLYVAGSTRGYQRLLLRN